MKREGIIELTKLFLKSYGYIPKDTIVKNAILFFRPTGMGLSDELLVYFHKKGEEGYLETRLTELDGKYSRVPGGNQGRRFLLSSEQLGVTPEAVKANNFKYQVPVWFFNREFSTQKKTTPLKQLETEVSKYEEERIEQPYKIGKESKSEDLLKNILNDLENPQEPCLRIIIAPAGYGKTVLMGTLYTKLKEAFIKNQKEQKLSSRPLLMIPGHVKQSKDLNSLIHNFIGDEYDYGVSNKDTFKFWTMNNLAVWLLDGLEELILKIPEEFILQILDEYIFTPGKSLSQIVITIRKPILATSSDLREVIEEWTGCGITVYELSEWGKEQKKSYFRKNLKIEMNEIEEFIKELDTSESLDRLCSVPFYCSLIADFKNKNEMRICQDDCELAEYAVDKLCEREFEKGLDKEILPITSQKELFDVIASDIFKGEKISGDILADLAEMSLSPNVAEDLRINQIQCIQRHAILTQVGENIDFMHDIIKQYFIGRCLSDVLLSDVADLQIFNASEIELDSLLMRYLLKRSLSMDWKNLSHKIYMLPALVTDKAIGFRNIMKVLLCTNLPQVPMLIRDKLENRNLTGLLFKNLDLKGFQFNRSKLDSAKFESCNLSNANFNGCYFKNTFFSSDCNLKNAAFKDAILESIEDKVKVYYDQKEITKFLYGRTQIPIERIEPCQAVINLRKILEKIARKGKGYKIPRKFIIQTKCGGGIPAIKCINTAVKYGIISQIGEQYKIRVENFQDVEYFIKHLKNGTMSMASVLYQVLNDICPDTNTGCPHIGKG